jgi:hypothetical protein
MNAYQKQQQFIHHEQYLGSKGYPGGSSYAQTELRKLQREKFDKAAPTFAHKLTPRFDVPRYQLPNLAPPPFGPARRNEQYAWDASPPRVEINESLRPTRVPRTFVYPMGREFESRRVRHISALTK